MVLVSGFVGVQFIPANPNQTSEMQQNDFIRNFNPPQNITKTIKNACYDCHSNNTKYPWYSKIQPVSLLMDKHVRDGKKELNFNEFTSYSKRKQKSKLKSIISQIEKKEMPLKGYTLLHNEAGISDTMRVTLTNWLERLRDSI